MSNPKSMIRAGLDKGEGFTTKTPRRGMTPPRFARFAGRRVGLTDLKISRNDIAKLHARLKEIRGAVTAALTEQGAAIRAKYDAEGWLPGERDGHRIDHLGPDRRRVMTDRALVVMRKEVVALVNDEVSGILLKLNEAKADLADARAAWVDPVTVLMRNTLASSERQVFMDNMANAGPVELLDYAVQANRENNLAMGAAILSRIDRLPGEMRKSLEFSKAQLAESLIHETFNAAVEHMALSEYAVLLASHEGREALGQTLNAGDKMKAGNELKKTQDEIGREIVPEDLGFKPVIDGQIQGSESKAVAAAEQAEATERAEMFAKWNAAEPLSEEWKRLGLEGGWLDEVDKGNEVSADGE